MLEKSVLKQVVSDWSYWEKEPPKTLLRTVLKEVTSLHDDLVLAITGVRRCGKSTLLAQVMQSKKLDPKRCFFFEF